MRENRSARITAGARALRVHLGERERSVPVVCGTPASSKPVPAIAARLEQPADELRVSSADERDEDAIERLWIDLGGEEGSA